MNVSVGPSVTVSGKRKSEESESASGAVGQGSKKKRKVEIVRVFFLVPFLFLSSLLCLRAH